MVSFKDLASLQKQVNDLGLEDKLGKQIFHAEMKKVIEPVSTTNKDVTKGVTKSTEAV